MGRPFACQSVLAEELDYLVGAAGRGCGYACWRAGVCSDVSLGLLPMILDGFKPCEYRL